ncbi:RecE family exodeoxyribonuclease [Salmonella bongori]|uniref:RecE family exodeoxyribonuclease n=1 Tax=Salmonella bongori TaxID=54736 RepID=UPI0009A9F7F2|nr:RecE family exodeoxyribonuclease [Salmonella bongori]
MSGTNPVFLVRKAKKSSGQKDVVLWCSDDFEAANATLDYLLIKSGAKLKDYFKAVATNFPVVNELPPEGELSLTFCDYYQLAKDNMTWTQIPGVTLPSSEAAAAARQHIVDGVDTETGEVLEDHTENFGNESNSPAQATAPAPELTVVATMPLRHRVLAQYTGEGEYLYHVDASQKKEILRLEMDTDNSYVQNLLLAAENVEAFKKAIEHDIHKIVNAVKKVFPVDGKTPELATVIQFLKAWFETKHIDRGLLVKEWAKGNRVSAIQRTESGANAGGGNKTDRNPDYEHTLDTLDVEIAMATLPMDFNIYELPGSVYRRAKEIVKKKESPFKEWSAALRATPGILDYSRAAIFALIRSAHPEFYHYPGRLQGYINANLTETDHETPTEEALTAARHTPEKDAVEEANRQLAAARGEYVEGISDPNDPKWVKTDTQPQVSNLGNGMFSVDNLMPETASNEGEKQEVTEQETVTDDQATQARETLNSMGYGVYATNLDETVQQEEKLSDKVKTLVQDVDQLVERIKREKQLPQASELVQSINEMQSAERDNLELWKDVFKTDERFTTAFSVNGGGTSINGAYMTMIATREFGPKGIGWGADILEERFDNGAPITRTVKGTDGNNTWELIPDGVGGILTEKHHIIKIRLWYIRNGVRGEEISFGCTPYIYGSKYGPICDGEATKKSLTDATKKALSALGFCADIFMGLYDNPEYRQKNKAEFALKNASENAEDAARVRQELDDKLTRVANTIASAVSENEINKVYSSIAREAEVHRKHAEAKGDKQHARYLGGRLRRLTTIKDERIAELNKVQEKAE